MAEFKLGRIRFVWQGTWTPFNAYSKDDIVRHGGNVYICLTSHTSTSSFFADQDSFWNRMSEGQEWKSEWQTGTLYKYNDVVKYGGLLYIARQEHISSPHVSLDIENIETTGTQATISYTADPSSEVIFEAGQNIRIDNVDPVSFNGVFAVISATSDSVTIETENVDVYVEAGDIITGLEKDSQLWDLYAEGFDYTEDWQTDNRYKENDLVKYGSTIYLCAVPHVSASSEDDGLEYDQDKWNVFSLGLEWKDAWESGLRYKVNDVVKYGGQIYVCNTGHISDPDVDIGLEGDQEKWDYFHKGIEFKGTWTPSTRYKANDLVKYGSGIWICTAHHESRSVFDLDEDKWSQFVEGLEFEDSWSPESRYQPGDIVSFGGNLYASKTNNIALKPPGNITDWSLFNTGFRFRGEWAEDSSNQEYKIGDVVRIGGFTYLCILTHETEERPPNTTYWEKLNSGIEWKDAWSDGNFYDLGDAVSITINEGTPNEVTNSYICIETHLSDEVTEQNRPDQDTTGIYWNLLSGGPENNVLTTQGDLLYYSGTGPTRLGIGQAGQALKVNSEGTQPEWAYLGQIDNVFYVDANNGVNQPAPTFGVTLDQPWQSVRYATYQIEQGALKSSAKYLIQVNAAWIVEETIDYVNDQINLGTGIWDGYVNDGDTINRPTFYSIINALVYDLSHAGNEKIRQQTLAFFDNSGDLLFDITDDIDQFIAALEYMQSVVLAVISNVSPSTVYNDDINTYKQIIDNQRVVENDAENNVISLFDILTNALNAQSTTNIPNELLPTATVYVQTGTFLETLPISVPKNCAIVGDELRSTRIEAAGSVLDSDYVDYTLTGLERLKDLVDPIVFGSDEIGSYQGNTVSYQETGSVIGNSTVAAEAADLFQQITDYINYSVDGPQSTSTNPAITGSNQPVNDLDYFYATEAIRKNKNFLIADVTAYVTDIYPAADIDTTVFENFIERYIDSVIYDLIYTGNYKSLTEAQFFVNAVEGSKLENMFLFRNGTGLRNCTVVGLEGVLSSPNEYGTQRPTAGAYASLDPGWGPDDEDVWIKTKSPYVQNVSTFGFGCVGCKIDGDLHNGGNDSIVANDFTQILSDGIGAWCTNLGRTELVSVFSYYAHIGYLAENGGKVRATNGNSSYGTFGTVAEGVDETEIPVTGTVNNRSVQAIIDRVITDNDKILTFEYLNAGINYTNSLSSIKQVSVSAGLQDTDRTDGFYTGVTGTSSGSGTGAEFTILVSSGSILIDSISAGGVDYAESETISVEPDQIGGTGTGFTLIVDEIGKATEFTVGGEGFGAQIDRVQTVDGGVFNVRMLDTDVTGDADGDFGGDGYFISASTAQGGNETSITLSNTEVAIPSQLFGLAIFIVKGLGGGQYGVIAEYNNGTKIAQIGNSAVGLIETTEVDGSGNITVTDTSELASGMEIKFTGTGFGGLQEGTVYLVDTIVDSTTFTITDQAGDPVSLTAATGTMFLYNPGWNQLVPQSLVDGKAIETNLDATTAYEIEPRVVIDPPAGGGYSDSAKARPIVDDEKVVQINIWDPGSGYTTAPTVAIEDPNNTIDAPTEARIGDGVLTQPTWTSRGEQFETAQALVNGDGIADQYQPGEFVVVNNLTEIPAAGSNVVFGHLPENYFKLVVVRDLRGSGQFGDEAPFSAQLQISPDLTISEAPEDGQDFEMRIRYSQVRLTGHDFLEIGTGNKADTNYPNEPLYAPDPEAETRQGGGGRVFYTSTDQDGNFRVGDLFSIEQSTGVATLNADAFNISGLNELSLGELGLGDTGVTITEFSADGTFTADSDNVVPTQKAIKTYITSQIGGGAATLNVNSITAGQIILTQNEITTTTGDEIVISQKINFEQGLSGLPAALNYFLSQ